MRERLQKILAQAGHGSRRSAETLIAAGRVRVNGVAITAPGTLADAESDRIEVDGRAIALPSVRVYLAMHKPAGYVTTARDPQRRHTVLELLPPGLPPHVFAVGRLDRDSEGLLLFTNDGELAHRLAHPRYAIEKEYHALVRGLPTQRSLALLRRGVTIEDRRTAPAEAVVAAAPRGHAAREGATWLRIVIHEGRKRQVRLMCAAIGHGVVTLVRTRVGGVRLGALAMGETRPLSAREVADLQRAVGPEHAEGEGRPPRRASL